MTTKKVRNFALISVIFVLIAVFTGIFALNGSTERAYAFQSLEGSAYRVGSSKNGSTLTELWNGSSFNSAAAEDLSAAILQGTGYSTVAAYVNDKTTVDCATLSANAAKRASGKTAGIEVKLGGINWLVTYLSKSTEGKVIATLYACDPITTAEFHTSKVSTYNGSAIETRLKNGTDLPSSLNTAAFKQYLTTPNKVSWQTSPNKSGGYYAEPAATQAWGADYFWLPSMTETYFPNVWNMTADQRGFATSTASYVWLRTAFYSTFANILDSDGSSNSNLAYLTLGLRPALHLNLESVVPSATKIPVPTLSTNSGTYNGSAQSFSLSNWNSTAISMSVNNGGTVNNSTGAVSVTNAATYTVTMSLKDANSYHWADDSTTNKTLTITIERATPAYDVPTGLTAVTGQTLTDVTLPSGWEWEAPDTNVGDVGNNDFSATFTPTDTTNYKPVTVSVTIAVSAPHVHTFAETWEHDGNYHWHAATCEHTDEVSGKAVHRGGKATCVSPAICDVCGQAYGEATGAHSFDYDQEPVWSWNGITSATATWTCANDPTHKDAHEVTGAAITGTVTIAQSCTDDEMTTYTASVTVNGKTYTNDSAPVKTKDRLGHNSDGNIAHKDATCTETGVEGGTYCTRCNDGKAAAEATINALGHNTDGNIAHKDATCTETGVVGGTYCTRCNDGKAAAEAAIDALGHNTDGNIAHKDATCTETGVEGGTYCTRCNDGKAAAEAAIDALGHNYGEWSLVKAATVYEFGQEQRVCANDNTHIETRQTPKRVPQLIEPSKDGGGDDEVVVSQENGFAHNVELVVTEIEQKEFSDYQTIADSVGGKIDCIYDITLKSDGVEIQPDGTLTIKLRIPDSLSGKNFKLFHLYQGTATDMEYTIDGKYAVVTCNELSEFIFVGEKTVQTPAGLSSGTLAGIIIGAILLLLLASYIATYFALYRKGVLKGKGYDTLYAPMNAIFKKQK